MMKYNEFIYESIEEVYARPDHMNASAKSKEMDTGRPAYMNASAKSKEMDTGSQHVLQVV